MKFFAFLLTLSSLSFAQSYKYGQDIVVEDLSSPQKFVLTGHNGRDGEAGAHGEDGRCYGEFPHRDGYDGENGKDGETGQDGGDAYVHFNHIKELKNLQIVSFGGNGGKGGRGGYGGNGCDGGQAGSSGRYGSDGALGARGMLYLIPSPLLYKVQQSSVFTDLKTALEKEFTLTENIWIPKDGASDLLMQGSVVAHRYLELKKIYRKKIVLEWKSQKDPENFQYESVSYHVNNENFYIQFGSSVAEYEVQETEDKITVTILDLVKISELISLSGHEVSGTGNKITVEFKDQGMDIRGLEKTYTVSVAQNRLLASDRPLLYNVNAQPFLLEEAGKTKIQIGAMDFMDKAKSKGKKLFIYLTIQYKIGYQTKVKKLLFAYKVGHKNSRFERLNSEY